MNRSVAVAAFAALSLVSAEAFSQAKVTKEQLAGTWEITSVELHRPDGTKVDPWGGKLVSQVIFMPNGRYSATLVRSDLPKFASKDRLKGTPGENQAVVHGVLTHFGTYTVDEAASTYTLNVQGSSWAHDVGTKQVRKINMFTGDEMQTTNATPTTGAAAYVKFKRIK